MGEIMGSIVLLDICNTIADINGQIEVITGLKRSEGLFFHPALYPGWFEENMNIFKDAPAMPGSVEGVNRLREEGYKIVYLSARPESARGITEEWLQRKGFPNCPLLFTDKKVEAIQQAGICQEDIAFAIDDAVHEIEQYKKAGIFVYVPKWDYNTQEENRFSWCY